MGKSVLLLTVVALVMVFSAPVYAGTASGSMAASCTVSATGTVSVTALTFAGSVGGSTNVDATSTITTQVTNGSAYTLTVDDGSNFAGGTSSQRDLKDGGTNYIDYEVYTDSARTSRFGTSGTEDVNLTGTGADQTTTAYGRIPSIAMSTPVGTYTDTLTVTITF